MAVVIITWWGIKWWKKKCTRNSLKILPRLQLSSVLNWICWTPLPPTKFLGTPLYVEKIHFLLKSDMSNRYFTWRLITFLVISRFMFLRLRSVSDKSCRENQNTFYVLQFFFLFCFVLENHAVCEIMWKNILQRTGHRWQYGVAHRLLDNYGYKHKFIICNTYCFSTTTMVARTCQNVTFILHWLFCFCVLLCTVHFRGTSLRSHQKTFVIRAPQWQMGAQGGTLAF